MGTKVIPELKGKLTGMAFRVPTSDVSVVDLTANLAKETTYEDICKEIQRRADGDMKGFLGYLMRLSCPRISSLALLVPFSTPRLASCSTLSLKLVAWYYNEWGYSNRVVDLMCHMAAKDG